MELPYSLSVYLTLMADYNQRWGLVVVAFYLALGLVAVRLVGIREGGRRYGQREVFIVLGACWVWVGGMHQARMMADLNFMAPYYALCWIGQGVLFWWLAYRPTTQGLKPAPRTGLIVAMTGLLAYPALRLVVDDAGWGVSFAGTSPDATLLASAGIMVMRGGLPVWAWVAPLVLAGVTSFEGYFLHDVVSTFIPVTIFVMIFIIVINRLKLTKG